MGFSISSIVIPKPWSSISRPPESKRRSTPFRLGNWVDSARQRHRRTTRKGTAFWKMLDQHGIPNSVFRIPANFPPVPAKGETLSGMGTPDLRGTYGTFTFYTDDPTAIAGAVEGGQIVPGAGRELASQGQPDRPRQFLSQRISARHRTIPVAIDPLEPVAKVSVQDQEFVLREGEWSEWVPRRVPADSVLRKCERHVPFLS